MGLTVYVRMPAWMTASTDRSLSSSCGKNDGEEDRNLPASQMCL